MLRRKPTPITLTSEDIAAYDDARAAERNNRLENVKPDVQVNNKGDDGGKVDPNDELKPLPGDRARVFRAGREREERIVGR